MKVLLLSDIHGNYEALEAVMAEASALGWKEIWSLGDLAGYGPEAGRCFERLSRHKILLVPGNHDLYYANRMKRSFFSREALQALLLSGHNLGEPYRKLLKSLPLSTRRKGCTLVHGSLSAPATDYILSEDEAARNFSLLKGRCLIFGHTHRQGCYMEEGRNLRWIKPKAGESVSFRWKRILINPGSVGQPRDNDPRAAWAILDTAKNEVSFFRSHYDIAAYQRKMRELGASDFLISRVERGI